MVVVDFMVDVEEIMVEGVSVWVVPVADAVEKGVVPVTGWLVFIVEVPVKPVGIVVLDNGFVVVPENYKVMFVSICQCFHFSLYYIQFSFYK